MTSTTPKYRLLVTGVFMFATLISAGALTEAASQESRAAGAVWTAGLLVLTVRAWRLGIAVTAGEARLRSFVRTYRLPLPAIVAVEVVRYDGLWRLPPDHWSTLRIRTRSGREVIAYGLLSRRWLPLHEIAQQLRHAAGLPLERTSRHPHQRPRAGGPCRQCTSRYRASQASGR
jgi:hypothetical protein